jgi:hypothetical protein
MMLVVRPAHIVDSGSSGIRSIAGTGSSPFFRRIGNIAVLSFGSSVANHTEQAMQKVPVMMSV